MNDASTYAMTIGRAMSNTSTASIESDAAASISTAPNLSSASTSSSVGTDVVCQRVQHQLNHRTANSVIGIIVEDKDGYTISGDDDYSSSTPPFSASQTEEAHSSQSDNDINIDSSLVDTDNCIRRKSDE